VNDKAIIAFIEGVIDSADQTCHVYEGMNVCYSGYNGKDFNYGEEWITIEGKTTRPLIMKAYGFQAGDAKVLYKWNGQDTSGTNGCRNPVIPPVVKPSNTDLEVAYGVAGSGTGSAEVPEASLLQSAASKRGAMVLPGGPKGMKGRFLLQVVTPGTEASHTCDMSVDETSCIAAGTECKWDDKTQQCSGAKSMVKGAGGEYVPASHSGTGSATGSAGVLIHATEEAMDHAVVLGPAPEQCKLEAKQAYDECKDDNEKTIDEQFATAEKEAKHSSNQVVANEAELKVQKGHTRAKKEVQHKKNKAKIVQKLDQATAAWQKEKKAKSAELSKKAQKEAVLVAKEKAKKAEAPERDAKERKLKAQPKCESAKNMALAGCQKTTNNGYLKCAEIFEKVHMSKTLQRPYNSIEGDIDVKDVVMNRPGTGKDTRRSSSSMQALETESHVATVTDVEQPQQYEELKHLEEHYDHVSDKIDEGRSPEYWRD